MKNQCKCEICLMTIERHIWHSIQLKNLHMIMMLIIKFIKWSNFTKKLIVFRTKFAIFIPVKFNEAAEKGKQMLTEGSKDRSALQAGYFQKGFTRVFEGESYTDPIKIRRQNRLKEMQKNIAKPFLPSSGEKRQ